MHTSDIDYVRTAIELVGNTPLVQLDRVIDADPSTGPLLLAKVEYVNPEGR